MEPLMPNLTLTPARPWFGLARVGGQIWRLIATFELALRVRRERRLLSSLDERSLKDMGFNRADAHAEAGRSFWDLPATRQRWLAIH